MDIQKVGVVGCGLMGSGIAEVAAKANFDVVVREVSDELVKAGRDRIQKSLDRAVERGKLTVADRDAAWSRLRFSTELPDLADRQLVIEAIVEEIGAKNELFSALDDLCGPETIFASNTSSLTITDMAAATGRPDRVVGLHFFNPVPVMELVEVVRTMATSDEAFSTAYSFAEALSANVRETRSTQRIRVGRRQRKRTCWDCEREWKRMVVPLEPGRPSEARQLLRTRR